MSPAAILDLIAVFVFALTGGLVASRARARRRGVPLSRLPHRRRGRQCPPIPVLGHVSAFWVGSPHYIGVACAAAILAFFTAHRLEFRLCPDTK